MAALQYMRAEIAQMEFHLEVDRIDPDGHRQTPNCHRLARGFVDFDNFYDSGSRLS